MPATTLTSVFNGVDEWHGSNALSSFKDLDVTHSQIATTQHEWEMMWKGAHIGETVCPPTPKLPEGKYAVCVFSCGAQKGEGLETPNISTDETGNLVVDYKTPKLPNGAKTIPWEQGTQHYYLKFIDSTSFKSSVIFKSARPF